MDKCKNCQNQVVLEEIKDYPYQFDEEDQIEILDVLKCPICGCIHHNSSTRSFYEYYCGKEYESNPTSGWAKSYNE